MSVAAAKAFDRNQIKDYLTAVEDDIAEFIGADFEVARIIGNISQQHAMGDLDDKQAQQLIKDATHLALLVELGRKYTKLARNPSAELRILVLADEARERRYA